MVGGTAAGVLAMVPVAMVESTVATVVWWCVAAVVLNGPIAATGAILPDRVPVAKRATVSALVGLGVLLGTAIGAVLGAMFVDAVGLGLMVAAVIAFVLTLVAVRLINEPDNRHVPVVRDESVHLLKASFQLPRNAADFYWALFGRLALVLGYFMINGFQFYILTDYVKLSDDRAAEVVGINAIIFLVTALISVVIAGPASDRLKVRKPFVIGATLVAMLGVVPPLLSSSVTAMHVFAVIGGLAFGAYFSVDAALVSEVLPDDESRARDLGIQNMANTGGQVLAPGASAALVALGVGFSPVFIAAIVIMGIGALLVVPIKSVR